MAGSMARMPEKNIHKDRQTAMAGSMARMPEKKHTQRQTDSNGW